MTDQQVSFDRTFDAAPELVFRAVTEPELVERWWSAEDEQTVVETL